MALVIDDFKDRIKKIAQMRAENLENFIALYLRETGLSIDEIMLIEERSPDGLRITWYCKPIERVKL